MVLLRKYSHLFGDPTLTAALPDRLTHKAHICVNPLHGITLYSRRPRLLEQGIECDLFLMNSSVVIILLSLFRKRRSWN